MTQPSNATIDLSSYVRDVVDFPKEGIVFKDLTTLWQDPQAFASMVQQLVDHYADDGVEVVAGIESRGLILGAPLALQLGTGLVPIRKAGKLPWKTKQVSYALEYGEATTEIHEDAFEPGTKVLIVDDLLATGGTAKAAVELVKALDGEIVGFAFLVELAFLNGREKLEQLGVPIHTLITYN